ncbi:TetR family transcriptional regulator [Amycolatopsis rubida]|uniref:TetR family transcriptional regulator n=1 Tax=Amycolatopsis rubida TaxID=112413 RepID=A0ABX0C3D7_9PSEU|nr:MULTISPECIES: TetR family transcriptional regulator [Amycolatopsis]MYW94440.1 hypothetical protein [Amycolatopsis rubida]NEC59428.1 TetR family transcriptional regulator [Amycolatopsis rubida]OAP27148.1 hypothetical protein A4R44_01956 [Amycolatopsis sp. M39]
MREIARQAEASVATVYRRSPTKDALITKAFAEELALCSSIVEEGMAAVAPWQGFVLVLEKLTAAHAREQGFRADRSGASALLIQSFRARPDAEPLPPAVRVPFS